MTQKRHEIKSASTKTATPQTQLAEPKKDSDKR